MSTSYNIIKKIVMSDKYSVKNEDTCDPDNCKRRFFDGCEKDSLDICEKCQKGDFSTCEAIYEKMLSEMTKSDMRERKREWLIKRKLKSSYGVPLDFAGNNCNDISGNSCDGWDGKSRRCQCGNRRVDWEFCYDDDSTIYAQAD